MDDAEDTEACAEHPGSRRGLCLEDGIILPGSLRQHSLDLNKIIFTFSF